MTSCKSLNFVSGALCSQGVGGATEDFPHLESRDSSCTVLINLNSSPLK